MENNLTVISAHAIETSLLPPPDVGHEFYLLFAFLILSCFTVLIAWGSSVYQNNMPPHCPYFLANNTVLSVQSGPFAEYYHGCQLLTSLVRELKVTKEISYVGLANVKGSVTHNCELL